MVPLAPMPFSPNPAGDRIDAGIPGTLIKERP
jgi:hypothetical protein